MKERNGMEIYVLVSIRNKSRITDNLNIFNIKKMDTYTDVYKTDILS